MQSNFLNFLFSLPLKFEMDVKSKTDGDIGHCIDNRSWQKLSIRLWESGIISKTPKGWMITRNNFPEFKGL